MIPEEDFTKRFFFGDRSRRRLLMMTASWSLTPETISVLSIRSVLFVKKRSWMLLPRVLF